MPSILELFQSKQLSSGQTAEVQYDIRNSKDSNLKTNSGVLDVAVAPVNLLRKSISARLKETRLEEETTGLRIIRTFSSPIIYGTALPKLLVKQSSSTITMKNGSNLAFQGNLVANMVNKAKEKVTAIANKVGVKFPEQMIPTTVISKMEGKEFPLTKEELIKIRDGAQGNLLGNLLSKPATPQQLGNQLLGAGINAAKKAVKDKLFGNNTFKQIAGGVNAENSLSIKKFNTTYTNKNLYTQNIKKRDFNDNGLKSILEKIQDKEDVALNSFVQSKNSKDFIDYAKITSDAKVSDIKVPEFSLSYITQNMPDRKNLKRTYSKSQGVANFNIDSDGKAKFKTKKDLINLSKPWFSQNGEYNELDDYDFISLRFYSVAKQTGVSFKAVINGLSETFSPSWEANKFLGSAYNFYTYSGIERSVSFSFKVYSLNIDEHISAWEKLNFLAGCTYPQQTANLVYNIPPFLKFTLGDMYKNKECFIDSLSFEIDDNSPWEIGLNAVKPPREKIPGTNTDKLGGSVPNRVNKVEVREVSKKDYKLPTIINVNIGLKFIETQSIVAGKRLYGYGGNSQNESNYGFGLDGSVLTNEPTAKSTKKVIDEFKKL